MSEEIPEPKQARPWRQEDGPEPQVTVYPNVGAPALSVWSAGAWRYARVRARQVWPPSAKWPHGRLLYQVEVDLLGDTTVRMVMYEWPQEGLRVAERPSQDATDAESMPRPPSRRPGA
ncbi:hypothetical protein [Streptomyces sp. NPDC001536]|uniref:hypothetical protein n=1 Tax=Streptomyces sp. NPDC001536 TaxID=3364583 RepID=UPI00367CD11D